MRARRKTARASCIHLLRCVLTTVDPIVLKSCQSEMPSCQSLYLHDASEMVSERETHAHSARSKCSKKLPAMIYCSGLVGKKAPTKTHTKYSPFHRKRRQYFALSKTHVSDPRSSNYRLTPSALTQDCILCWIRTHIFTEQTHNNGLV